MVQCEWCDKLFKKPADLVKHSKEYMQVDSRKDKSSTNTSRCGRRCVKIPKGRKGGKGKAQKDAVATVAAEAAASKPVGGESPSTKQFVHTAAFDKSGVLHWIATDGGTKPYANPHGKPGGVVAKMSSEGGNGSTPSRFVDHAQVEDGGNYTKDIPNSSMSVDLGEGRQLAPDYYCLRHGDSSVVAVLQNWQLEGSNDDTTWAILKTHAREGAALDKEPFCTASWPIQAPAAAAGTPYRYFRILQTGQGTDGDDYLPCAGIELYGLLTVE